MLAGNPYCSNNEDISILSPDAHCMSIVLIYAHPEQIKLTIEMLQRTSTLMQL